MLASMQHDAPWSARDPRLLPNGYPRVSDQILFIYYKGTWKKGLNAPTYIKPSFSCRFPNIEVQDRRHSMIFLLKIYSLTQYGLDAEDRVNR